VGARQVKSAWNRPWASRLAAAGVFLLLGLAQVMWAGYQMGGGNQSIQVPFLYRSADSTMYPADAMVQATYGRYPSIFFRALGPVAGLVEVGRLYFALHVLSAAGVLGGVYALGRAVFDSRATGVVMALILFAAHHRALAGDAMYSGAFTHTWAVFGLAIWAMVLLYRGRHAWAMLLAGCIMPLHALTGAYLVAMFGLWALAEARRNGWKATAGMFAAFAAAALPTLVALPLTGGGGFDEHWLQVMRVRSAEHFLASTWWRAPNPDVPRFALIVGLACLSLSFPAEASRHRKSLWLAAAVGGMFIVGVLLTEVYPVAAVIRGQLFRASRLILVVAFCHIAHGIVRSMALAPRAGSRLCWWMRWMEAASALAVLGALAVPPLLPWLPWAFAMAALAALVSGRMAWWQAAVAGAAALVCIAAWRTIRFDIPGLGGEVPVVALQHAAWGPAVAALACAGAAGLLWRRSGAWAGALVALGGALPLGIWSYRIVSRDEETGGGWVQIQRWVRQNTPAEALVLTPLQPGGFRVHSLRSVVCEWRDGTQAFFSGPFAGEWWSRVQALQPGIVADSSGRRLLSPGRSLAELSDAQIIELARKYKATHVVLPVSAEHKLVALKEIGRWGVYLPEQQSPPDVPMPPDVVDKDRWRRNQQYIDTVVLPNIEKHRKSDLRVQIVEADGRAAYDMPVRIVQKRHAFHFSGGLNFFQEPRGATVEGYRPGVVAAAELEAFERLFNFSLIPFSGKWMFLEPEPGVREYADLDQYVQWCAQRGIGMEYHFLSGYPPRWFWSRPVAERQKLFLDHARQVVQRYKDRIEYWQVVNERILIDLSVPVFEEIRRMAPAAKLGISDCTRFSTTGWRLMSRREPLAGLTEVKWLRSQGVKLDYFGFHGHRPFGAWPDAQTMYESMDAFANEGLRLHITEFSLPLNQEISGGLRHGRFTPELQAEFYAYIYTVCFSHPAVDMINLWQIGPGAWQAESGLLDEQYRPRPNCHALEKLIRQEWMTRYSGRLPLDGTVSLRGFHGTYDVEVDLPGGQTARGELSVVAGGANQYRLRLDRGDLSLRAQ